MDIVQNINESSVPKYRQIVMAIEQAIVNGALKRGDKLPSLNSIKNQHSLSRDTVLMAFSELKIRGIIESKVGKGYYVISEDINVKQRVFLLFDELNAFKEDLYNSFLHTLGTNVQVDIFFHHFNKEMFSKLINDNVGDYSHYVIMPANLKKSQEILKQLPADKVFILDQMHTELNMYPSVHQNFEKDIYSGLLKAITLIEKYKKIILSFSPEIQPMGILSGFKMFCENQGFEYDIITSIKDRVLKKGDLYILLDDKNLIRTIKKIKGQQLVLGEEVGIISYNETLLKEILEGGITTISTDFNLMGKRLAEMILAGEYNQVENPNSLIIRKSL